MRTRTFFVGLCLGLVLALTTNKSTAADPTGGFFVHANQQSNNGDSRRSITFYDADELQTGTASPLFSVHIPGDQYGPGSFNAEEISSITTDPATGDVYVLSFDSGTPGTFANASGDSPADSNGDFDLYRIDFGLVYDHWSSNYQGNSVVAGTTSGVGGLNPFIPAGAPAGGFDDYITYGSTPLYDLGPGFGTQFDAFSAPHPNTFRLDGAISKIAEVKRNEGDSGFYDLAMEFIDSDTLAIIDNSVGPDAAQSSATDHQYRLLERVSTSPGTADDATSDFEDGGYNRGAAESWNSRRIGSVALDFGTSPEFPDGFHSNPESAAYYEDPLTGTRGFWVTESDGGGDDIAFWDLDTNSYRLQATGEGQAAFALDNDPNVEAGFDGIPEPGAARNDGKADNIFVDADTGDLIIIEAGFGDQSDGITSAADHEPAVIRREVIAYDDGEGQIQFGAWSEKVFMTPEKNGGSDPGFLERGAYSAYDSENDLVYFYNPGGGGDYNLGPNGVDDGGPDASGSDDVDSAFQMDIQILDINTGVTTTLLDVDESIGFLNAFANLADFFSLETPFDGLAGDYNNDGTVDAADYTVWRDALDGGGLLDFNESVSPGVVDQADYDAWASNFGATAPMGSAVPEPTTLLLAAFAAAGLASRRQH